MSEDGKNTRPYVVLRKETLHVVEVDDNGKQIEGSSSVPTAVWIECGEVEAARDTKAMTTVAERDGIEATYAAPPLTNWTPKPVVLERTPRAKVVS